LFVRKLVLLLVLGTLASAQELKIAAASDLTAAMQKVGAAFEKQSGVHVNFSFGSSGNFFAQIRNGAPFDVFLSADRSYPETLDGEGKTDQGTIIYARGKLVAWYPSRLSLNLKPNNLTVLASKLVNKVSIANPEHAPYGRAAVASMIHYKVYDQVKPKLVLGENVSQAAQFAQSGNADVALIALSLALTDGMQKSGQYVIIDPDSYPPLDQAAVVLHSSQNKTQAHRFLQFLQSPVAQKILHDYGFESR
jgi:molybdate transport system substrate-binding protein